ncbi:DUF6273 domain-containing protein [Collinsella sp. SGI.184]|uniref:DUF6273 domain-containing protein n=1 Tax=Collinsella sp. SGI.184 TaxID=3420556 RepID=UPI003D035137
MAEENANAQNYVVVEDPLMSDSTGKELVSGIKTQNALMAQLVRNGVLDSTMDWNTVKNIVASGLAQHVFSIGDQFIVNWSDGTTEYQVPLDIVAFGTKRDRAGNILPKMTLQWHYTLPFGTTYNARSAFYVAGDGGLPVGTYNVTMGYSQGTVVNGKTYQFTITKALPAGGQLLGFFNAWDTNPEKWKVYNCESATATSIAETVSVTEGSEGTNLGTFLSDKPNGDLNCLQRCAYGSNRPDDSDVFQYLNSDAAKFGEVWKPSDKFDHIPCAPFADGPLNDRQGFLKGFSDDFLSVIGGLRVDTCTNYVCDGGTSGEPNIVTCYPKFYLPSLEEMNIVCNEASVNGKEGEVWPYNRLASGSNTRLPLWQTFQQMRSYAINAKTTPQHVFLRSPRRGGACSVFCVDSSGALGSTTACPGNRVRPACDIVGIKE